MRRVAPSPASMRYGVPLTTSRLEDCVRPGRGSGPPLVPSVMRTVPFAGGFDCARLSPAAATSAMQIASAIGCAILLLMCSSFPGHGKDSVSLHVTDTGLCEALVQLDSHLLNDPAPLLLLRPDERASALRRAAQRLRTELDELRDHLRLTDHLVQLGVERLKDLRRRLCGRE